MFADVATLPRGPHSMAREDVAESQRIRLMGAMASLMTEFGYAGTTIGALATYASVSRAAFYEHFEDKEDCLIAAYDRFVEVITERTRADDPAPDWETFVEGALTRYFAALQSDPIAARAFLVEMEAAGPRARQRRRDAFEAFARRLEEGHAAIRAADPSLGELPAAVYVGLAHAIHGLATDALEASRRPDLLALVPGIVEWIRASIRGAGTPR